MRPALRAVIALAIVQLVQAAVAIGAVNAQANAQAYPSRPITLIVTYPAGGPTDTLARILAERMKAPLGQPVIVENVAGAGGSIGTGRVARAAPDGHMLVIGHVQTHVMNAAILPLQYDVVKDFEPVSLVADTPQWLVAKKTMPGATVAELVAWLKANPGKATVGAVGIGGPPDVAAIHFQKQTGTSFQIVPYRGGAPMVQDLLAGQIDFTFGQAASQLNLVRNGQLKAYAVLTEKRWRAAPDLPTMDEAGVPGMRATFWHGIWAPKGTPKDIIEKLNAAIVESLADPAVKKRYSDIGQEIWPVEHQNPAALAAQQKAEIERWWPIIKAAGIKAE
jgi:tripartite-type tricarboxylate transporter receptor subunit TctC